MPLFFSLTHKHTSSIKPTAFQRKVQAHGRRKEPPRSENELFKRLQNWVMKSRVVAMKHSYSA